MNQSLRFLTALLLVSSALLRVAESASAADTKHIRLPIRVHLVSDLPMAKKGVLMTNWVTPEMIAKTVLPEVNRIWSGAGIEWTLRGVTPSTTKGEGRAQTIAYVLQARRNANGKSDPERVRKLRGILETDKADARAVNVHVIPYLGETSQGVASPGRKQVIMGQWTDKPSRGRRPPEKCLLVEPGDFKQGSFSRTLAHELGHILGLGHPAQGVPPFPRLMGGSNPGNELTREEIATARKTASTLRSRFQQR